MAKSYPDDLRELIISFVNAGNSRRAAAREFDVSPSFVVKLLRADGASNTKAASTAASKVQAAQLAQSSEEISGADLAEILGVSKRSISDFAERGIIQRLGRNRFHERRSIQLYCDHLRTVAAGRGGDGSNELTLERARLAREQADGTALKNAALRRELITTASVQREWTAVCRKIRNAMLAVPSRVRQSLVHLTAFDVDLIDREIRAALIGLADDDDGAGLVEAGGLDKPAAAAEASAFGMDREERLSS